MTLINKITQVSRVHRHCTASYVLHCVLTTKCHFSSHHHILELLYVLLCSPHLTLWQPLACCLGLRIWKFEQGTTNGLLRNGGRLFKAMLLPRHLKTRTEERHGNPMPERAGGPGRGSRELAGWPWANGSHRRALVFSSVK